MCAELRIQMMDLITHLAYRDKVSDSLVKSYARILRSLGLEARLSGPAALALLTDLPLRRVKSHWLGERLPRLGDHTIYLKAIVARVCGSCSIYDEPRINLGQRVPALINAWRHAARQSLDSAFVESDDHAGAITWPEFVERWTNGKLRDRTLLSVAVDFSGHQRIGAGWILRLRRVRPGRKPLRESLVVVNDKGRPRLALRLEHAPGAPASAALESWSLYPDEILWRSPDRRIVVLDENVQAPSDPDLTVLRTEIMSRGALPLLFVSEPQQRP